MVSSRCDVWVSLSGMARCVLVSVLAFLVVLSFLAS